MGMGGGRGGFNNQMNGGGGHFNPAFMGAGGNNQNMGDGPRKRFRTGMEQGS